MERCLFSVCYNCSAFPIISSIWELSFFLIILSANVFGHPLLISQAQVSSRFSVDDLNQNPVRAKVSSELGGLLNRFSISRLAFEPSLYRLNTVGMTGEPKDVSEGSC